MKKYILERDLGSLRTKRDELLLELREIGNEIRDSLEQSSETWHDNAPFEALVAREKNVSIRMNEIVAILEDTELFDEEVVVDLVGVGSRVVCQVGDDLREYVVAGSWLHPENYHPYKAVSSHSPLGSQLLGKTLGDIFVPDLPTGDTTPWLVIDIQQFDL